MCGALCLSQQAGRNRNTALLLLHYPTECMNAWKALPVRSKPLQQLRLVPLRAYIRLFKRVYAIVKEPRIDDA
jgi:hypothetical protein